MADLSRAVNIEDLRQMARRRLPRAIFDFFDGGLEVFNVFAHGVAILPSDRAGARRAHGGGSSGPPRAVLRKILGFA